MSVDLESLKRNYGKIDLLALERDYSQYKIGEPDTGLTEAYQKVKGITEAVPKVQEAGFDPTTAFLPKPFKSGLGERFAKNIGTMAQVQTVGIPGIMSKLTGWKPSVGKVVTREGEEKFIPDETGEMLYGTIRGLGEHYQEYVKETGQPFSWKNVPMAFLKKIQKDPAFAAMDVAMLAGLATMGMRKMGVGARIKPKEVIPEAEAPVKAPTRRIPSELPEVLEKPKEIVKRGKVPEFTPEQQSALGLLNKAEKQFPQTMRGLSKALKEKNINKVKSIADDISASAFKAPEKLSDRLYGVLDAIHKFIPEEQLRKVPRYEEIITKPEALGERSMRQAREVKEIIEKGKAKEPWEMTVKEFQTKGSPNYGDLVTDGEYAGYLRGSGGIGSKRVIIEDKLTGLKHYTDRNKIKLVRRMGQGSAIQDVNATEFHKNIVQQALSEGKPVPPEVLADYPDLAKPVSPPKAGKPAPKAGVPKETPPKTGFVDFVESAELAAKERIKKRGVRLTTGIDPMELADYTIIGAAKIAKGTIQFVEWSKAMIAEFGDKIKPYLAKIYNESKAKQIDLMKEHGKIEVPGGKERGFTESVKAEVPELQQKVQGQYIPRSTDELAIKARTLIETDMGTAERLAKTGIDERAVATASELIKHYNDLAQRSGKGRADVFYDKAAEYANIIAPKLTELGRSVQAASILGRLTPEGMLRFAAREIQRYNAKAELSRFRKKIPELTGKQSRYILEEMQKIEKMPDGTEKAMAFQKMTNYVSDLTPTPAWRKIINVWKAGLLTGVKTSGLNTFSNLFHGISEVIKDIPAAGIDRVASLFTGERTLALTGRGVGKGIIGGFGKGWRYLKTGFDERNIGAKLDWKRVGYGDSRFAKAVQTYEQTVFRSMGAEDQPFYYGAKARSIQSQAIAQAKNLKLKGKSAKSFVNELVANPTDEMIKNAATEAEIAVFQNQTYLGKAARQVQKIPGGEFVVPFGRTPSAVAMQMVNYSPVGIVKTIIENIGKGRFNQRAFSQGVARGMTGTAIMYIGGELYKKDMITLDYPKSEKERKLWELEGRKSNSIKFGGSWRNINVLGPGGMVLIAGGHYKQALDETGSIFQGMVRASSGGAKSLTEQTFLRGLNQAVQALNDPDRFFTGYVRGTTGSIVPTIIGDVARATDTSERRMESPLQSIKSRIPGLRQTLEPRVDVLGQNLERGGNFLDTMINPTRPSKIKTSPLIEEFRRLWDLDYRVSPSQVGNRAGYEGLTPQQNTKLWQLTGTIIENDLTPVIQNDIYKESNDEDKAKLLDKFIRDAKITARAIIAEYALKDLTGEIRANKLDELRESRLITNQVIDLMFDRIEQPQEELSYGVSP